MAGGDCKADVALSSPGQALKQGLKDAALQEEGSGARARLGHLVCSSRETGAGPVGGKLNLTPPALEISRCRCGRSPRASSWLEQF